MNSQIKKPLIADETMTDEDFATYFECRKLYDKEFTEAEIEDVYTKALELREKGETEAADNLINTLPADANVMLSAKHQYGLKAVQVFNLSKAKRIYPKEF